jgi:hypothetical protein
MNCNEVQFKISEWVDGDGIDEPSRLQDHVKLCARCAAFYRDIQAIKETSSSLLVDPPDQVWTRLRRQLVSEGLIQAPQRRTFWERLFPVGFTPGLKPALIGATLALILSTTVFYFYPWQGRPETSVSPEAAVFQELKQAEAHYQKAIEALKDVSQKKIEMLDPAMAQILNDNLATMDYYVKECQDAVKNNPDNPLVHKYLLTAYQKKVEIMQSIVNSDVL